MTLHRRPDLLRQARLEAPRNAKGGGEGDGEVKSMVEKAAEVVQKILTYSTSDRTTPPYLRPEDKKAGTYVLANMVLKLLFAVSHLLARVVYVALDLANGPQACIVWMETNTLIRQNALAKQSSSSQTSRHCLLPLPSSRRRSASPFSTTSAASISPPTSLPGHLGPSRAHTHSAREPLPNTDVRSSPISCQQTSSLAGYPARTSSSDPRHRP
jgi:hypothetical protein